MFNTASCNPNICEIVTLPNRYVSYQGPWMTYQSSDVPLPAYDMGQPQSLLLRERSSDDHLRGPQNHQFLSNDCAVLVSNLRC